MSDSLVIKVTIGVNGVILPIRFGFVNGNLTNLSNISAAEGDLPLTAPDLVCLDDVNMFGAETTSDLQSLIQDVFHVLEEAPGSNPDDPDRGVGVYLYLSGDASKLHTMARAIEHQLSQDDRIDSVTCTIEGE